jgi:hypothetical protein
MKRAFWATIASEGPRSDRKRGSDQTASASIGAPAPPAGGGGSGVRRTGYRCSISIVANGNPSGAAFGRPLRSIAWA